MLPSQRHSGAGRVFKAAAAVGGIAEGLFLGHAATAKGCDLARDLERIALGIDEGERAADAVGAVVADGDDGLGHG
jgi:hypothetical protein